MDMRLYQSPARRVAPAARVLLLLGILVGSAAVVGGPVLAVSTARPGAPPPTAEGPAPSLPDAVSLGPRAAVLGAAADEPSQGAVPLATASSTVPVLLSLQFSNDSKLQALLAALDDPNSSEYHRYLTAAQFTEQFAPSERLYGALVGYLRSEGIASLTTFPDRLAIEFDATGSSLGGAFGASLSEYAGAQGGYWAFSSPPTLPSPLAGLVGEIVGVGPGSAAPVVAWGSVSGPLSGAAQPSALSPSGSAYPTPVTVGGVQEVYPSDLQVGYDEEGLLDQFGAPTNDTLAALVWSGAYGGSDQTTACATLTTGESVGAYDPADLSEFFATTTPTGEPTATVYPVSVEGAPAPGCGASWDTTGVVATNTAELEAMGAMAPGAPIYAVAAPGPSIAGLEAAFATVLSPPTNLSTAVRDGLGNVTVVSVGWGTTDTTSTAWSDELTQAQARGITVVAAVGDSGDNPHSSAWVGTRTEFPASDATETDGALAVGGTTVKLDPTTLHVAAQSVWNVSSADTADGGPLGTAGGVSAVYAEPAFQKSSPANALLKGVGRGMPDVTAFANNSLVTLTVDGIQYDATNVSGAGPYRTAAGTAVAAGIVAGLLAVVDHALRYHRQAPLGYADPEVYALATEEYTPPVSGAYAFGLPTLVFNDIKSGRNDFYSASGGYDLVSGWGSLDAYNLTMYALPVAQKPVYGELAGVEDIVHLASMSVTTTIGSAVNTAYNASVQQNFFLASPLGDPIYWVQSVIYAQKVSGGWAMNFTGWVAYPFWGLYPALVTFDDRFPAAGVLEKLPLSVTMTTTLTPAKGTTPAEVKFTYGVPGADVLTIPVPGAAYIIGRTGYSYSWQGTTYTDGPRTTTSPFGFLAPQLVVVGGPSRGTGTFRSPSAGTVTAYTEQLNSTVFALAQLGLVNESNTQTGESAVNLAFTVTGAGTASYAYASGASDQGVYQVAQPWYPVEFLQTGASASSHWYVNLSNGYSLAALGNVSTLATALPNGSYTWTAATSVAGWTSLPASGTVKVAGTEVQVTLSIGPALGAATFEAKGPHKGSQLLFRWYVNITGQPSHAGTALTYTANLSYGTYTYHVAVAAKGYYPTKASGSVTVSRTAATVYVTIEQRTYLVEFLFVLPKTPPRLTISFGNVSQSGSFQNWGVYQPNGTYNWSVGHLPLGYDARPSHGTLHVAGAVSPITITVTEPGWGPLGLGVLGYALVVGAPALAAIWYCVYRVRRRRAGGRKPPAAPPRPRRKSRPRLVRAGPLGTCVRTSCSLLGRTRSPAGGLGGSTVAGKPRSATVYGPIRPVKRNAFRGDGYLVTLG